MLSWIPVKKEEKRVNVFGFKLNYEIPKMKGHKISS